MACRMASTKYILFFTSIFFVYIAARMKRGCVLQAVPGSLNKFTIHKSILGYQKEFYCANGTVFDQEECICVMNNDPNIMPTAPPQPQNTYTPDPGNIMPGRTTEPPCNFRPDMDRQYYQEYVSQRGWQRRPCALGTLYNESICLCVDMAPVSSAICTPQLWIDFNDKKINDIAGTNIYIKNTGVESVEGAGMFNRKGRLHIPRYANAGFGQKLTVTFRFYDFPGGDEEQVLLSNCHNGQLGSLEIIMNPANQEIIFRADTTRSEPKEIRVPYPTNAWKNVTLTYDGTYLKGMVNQEESSVLAKGNIESRSGLKIGQCSTTKYNKRAFVGYIDDLKIHKCVKNGGYFGQPGYQPGSPLLS